MGKPKEGINIENNTEKIDFETLRQKIELIRKGEMMKKEADEHFDPHFEKINSVDLTEEDLKIFKDFLENKLTFERFKEYQYGFRNFRAEEVDKISSYWFMAWLGNKMMIRQLEKTK